METSSQDLHATDPIISIGTMAEKLGISVSAIRKYEAMGLIIPYRSDSGHRLFSVEDINRIRKILYLIQERGLNIKGIRSIQAFMPCWKLLPCTLKRWKKCPGYIDPKNPCWTKKGVACIKQGNECRLCQVYRFGTLHIKEIKNLAYHDAMDNKNGSGINELLEKYKIKKTDNKQNKKEK